MVIAQDPLARWKCRWGSKAETMGPKAKGGEVQMGSKGETSENFYSMLPIYDYGFFVFEDRGYFAV